MIIQNKLLEILQDSIKNNKKVIEECSAFQGSMIDIEKIKKDTRKYEKIVAIISEPKNMNFITDIDLLGELFDNNKLTEEEKKILYQFILKYNKKIYERKTGSGNIKELESLGKMDASRLKKIFKSFDYEFDKLPFLIQENITNLATVSNIKEVFKALKSNGYVLNIEKDAYLLMALVIDSDEMTINRVSELAFSKGLSAEQVLTIGGILIKQFKNKIGTGKTYDRFNIEDIEKSNLKIAGSAIDFEKNVKTLSGWGISVKYVYDRCKYILICPNEVLSHNLSLFQDYGFSLKQKTNKLCSAMMAALMEYNTVEIIDRFIEVHPLGLKYLRQNLSVLRQVNDLEDLIFYKLYYSNKTCGSEEAFMTVINNNSSLLCLQGKVSGLTSIYIQSYAGINEDNKYEITGTFFPTYNRDYYSLVKNRIGKGIQASIFDNPYVQRINVYSDCNEPLLYNFEGIRISKLKVLRILDALISAGVVVDDDSFLFALLYNTIINKDDFDKLSNIIRLSGQVV